mgnify:CR=1 FL=1
MSRNTEWDGSTYKREHALATEKWRDANTGGVGATPTEARDNGQSYLLDHPHLQRKREYRRTRAGDS